MNETEGPEKGLFLRNAESQPFVIDRRTGMPAPWDGKGVQPDLGAVCQGHRTVFQHLAERYLSPDYAPEAVAERCGIPAARIRALAAELARVAFDEAIELDAALDRLPGQSTIPTCPAARSASTRCAASRPIPTASRPPARCICCRSCWARWRRPAATA